MRCSPRTRGCSPEAGVLPAVALLLPAHAGMFPSGSVGHRSAPCFPRMCGYGPPARGRGSRA
ncbi:hypothetical protein FH609_007160 [Streptomyces sp. 3MP-14]|uniref:Uncharacterized protein n=1 Tax=Streptomyces mimosae TaxID=2586635 RepID=A0A5N6AJB3_9ACTN|nr:hypothetical protein FH607_006205 [Streptomyces mimosae]KAB8177909.1 hypothetical protein FH609_007160 [Streptomyces sp. 3MP-14]